MFSVISHAAGMVFESVMLRRPLRHEKQWNVAVEKLSYKAILSFFFAPYRLWSNYSYMLGKSTMCAPYVMRWISFKSEELCAHGSICKSCW